MMLTMPHFGLTDLTALTAQVLKVDTVKKEALVWSEENVYPSEPIFVPAPDSKVSVLVRQVAWPTDGLAVGWPGRGMRLDDEDTLVIEYRSHY